MNEQLQKAANSTPEAADRRGAIERLRAKRDLSKHVIVFAVVNASVVMIWVFTGAGYFWPVWLIAGWGIGLLLHAGGARPRHRIPQTSTRTAGSVPRPGDSGLLAGARSPSENRRVTAAGYLLCQDVSVTEANTAAAFAAYTRALQAPALIAAAQEKVRQTAERRAVEEDRLASLYGQLNHITGWNLATWLPRVTGRIRDRQSKVADAILQQHVRRDNAAAEHETALGTMLRIQAAIDGLPLAREAAVAAMTGAGAGQAQQQVTVAKELSGALAAVGRAQAIVTSMTGELTSAQLWSGHDTYLGGGIMSSALKQDRIYEANDLGAALTQELTTLRKNLQDLNVPTSYFSVQNNDVIASTDVTFDNIFSDFVMSTRINNAQDRLERLKLGLVEVSAKLGNEHKAIVEQLDQLLATEMNARPPQPSA